MIKKIVTFAISFILWGTAAAIFLFFFVLGLLSVMNGL